MGRIKRQQAHTETFKDAQRGNANLTGADNAGGFTVHSEAGQPLKGEVSIASALIGAMNAAVERHHHADCVLSDRFRRVGRDAYYPQAQFFRGVEVNVVEPGAAQRDVLHAVGFQFFKYRAATVIVNENAYRFTAVGGFGGLFGEQEVKNSSSKPYASLTCCRYFLSYCFVLYTAIFIRLFSSDNTVTVA